MTKVLGYSTYAIHGTDWGSVVAYSMYSSYNDTVRASHFTFLPFVPPTPQEIADANVTLTPLEQFGASRVLEWDTKGNAYLQEQSTRPNTIGLALFDNPVGQLVWIADPYVLWSDPQFGVYPSTLTNNTILTEVSLYYLTQTIISSAFIYAQNANGFMTTYTKADTDAPLLYSFFKYNVAFYPREWVAQVGNLVRYTGECLVIFPGR